MRTYQKIKLTVLFVSCVCFLPVLNAQADVPAAEEWVDIPVVVNIIDASDASNVDDAIKKANEILKQANIRLVVKKTNNNVNVGNGDPNLTEAEGDTAQEDGQKELDKVCGAGKGIKITVADDCWTEDPNTVGWSVHRNPVIVIEPDADANEMGETITHELLHSLTVTAHSNDVNDVMYPTEAGNGIINPNDVNEIFPNAKKRGKPYLSCRGYCLAGPWQFQPVLIIASIYTALSWTAFLMYYVKIAALTPVTLTSDMPT